MRRSSSLLVAALASMLASGCQTDNAGKSLSSATTSSSTKVVTGKDNEPLPVPSLSGPTKLAVFDDYLHRGTGFIYPKVAANYARVVVVAYDPDEMDVSTNYVVRRSDGIMMFSTYIYPVTGTMPTISPMAAREPATCRRLFDQVVGEAMSIFREPKIDIDEIVPSPVDAEKSGHHAVLSASGHPAFSEQGMPGPLKTEVYLFCDIDTLWLLKYRITYPASMDAKPIVAELMKSVPRL